MDCGIVVVGERAPTIAVSDVKAGDRWSAARGGVKVVPLPAIDRSHGGFEFMNSEVSSEKPQALLVRQIAQQMREVKAEGKKVLWVGGPAVVHTGAAPAMVALVEAGYVDVLFAGNALATHDIEAALFGTSLGRRPQPGPRGRARARAPHPRDQPDPRGRLDHQGGRVRRAHLGRHARDGHRRQAVRAGRLGPRRRPAARRLHRRDRGQRAMRAGLADVGFAIMVATMLHSVATGNILPASVPLVCVDINPATVTKLADRFARALARELFRLIGVLGANRHRSLDREPSTSSRTRSAGRAAGLRAGSAATTRGPGRKPRPGRGRFGRSRAGASISSPSRTRRPPMTTTSWPGRQVGDPWPSHGPTSVTSSRASGSPSAAAAAKPSPVSRSASPATSSRSRPARPGGVSAISRAVCASAVPLAPLPAAAVAAGAEPAVGHDPHVAPLPRDAVRSAAQPAVEDDAAADAGAQRDHQREVGPRAAPWRYSAQAAASASLPTHSGRRSRAPGPAQGRVPPGQVRAEEHGVAGAVEPPAPMPTPTRPPSCPRPAR